MIQGEKVNKRKNYFIKTRSFRPYNTLSLKGSFSQAEMHSWISYCIPEVPEKNQAVGNEKAIYYFQNVFAGTSLQCEYR